MYFQTLPFGCERFICDFAMNRYWDKVLQANKSYSLGLYMCAFFKVGWRQSHFLEHFVVQSMGEYGHEYG